MKKSIGLFFLLVSAALTAQISTPQPSPLSTVNQKIALSEATVTYSRPSTKGRKIFGDLVAFGKLWRTGANMATVLKLSDEAKIAGNTVPAGEYSLLSIPGEKEWTMILNKNSKLSGTYNYKQEEDVLRFQAKSERLNYLTETFTINFSDLKEGSATLDIIWEQTKVSFQIEFEYDSKVAKQITDKMAGPSKGEYFTAARYYYETKRDLNKALEWIDKALENNEKYWILTVKAKIQAELGKFKDAIATAQKAKDLALKDEDDSYVKQNEENMAKWQKSTK